jgi:radical SAM superfamily enzyme YgiQ (UPF0313 family)
MNIKLIAPHDHVENSLSSLETFNIQWLILPLLAAFTPADHKVTIIDEAIAPDEADGDVDLLGITVTTDLAQRAYTIADLYRRGGTKVVMGGIHPSVLPGEALKFADSVIVGEAEEVWPRLVSDAASGKMKRLYRASKMTDLKAMPQPRRDLYPKPSSKSYISPVAGIETSRGCPYDCEFCSIGAVMGPQYRCRPVSEVIAEIESVDSPYLFFVDDALALNRPAAKKLFKEMIPLQRKWAGQGTVSLADDLELLRLMKRSGCHGLLIGFESVQKEAQHEMKKIRTLTIDFFEAMRRFHGEGIPILGAFVFGFDHEDKHVFDQTLEFSMKYRLDCVQLRILVPYPGTRLYARLLKEGRLFAPQWWLDGYSSDQLLFQLKGMTPDEFLNGFTRLNREVFSLGSMIKRFFGISPWKRTATGSLAYTRFNLARRKRYFIGLGDLRLNIHE